MGERDIEKKVLDLPIPLFRADNGAHQTLAGLGSRARSEAQAFLANAKLSRLLGQQRAEVREAVAGVLDEIDEAVRQLVFRS
jgi:hypothetical protein